MESDCLETKSQGSQVLKQSSYDIDCVTFRGYKCQSQKDFDIYNPNVYIILESKAIMGRFILRSASIQLKVASLS